MGDSQTGEVIPYRDPILLAAFMQQPAIKVAEAITGAIAQGWSGLAVSGCRIVQGAIKGKMMQQFGIELKKLVESGKIKEDYVDSKYGFKTLADILAFIDNEAPDEDRFQAVKAVFCHINSIHALNSEELLNYQILQIVMKLTSSQILLLKNCYDLYLKHKEDNQYPFTSDTAQWLAKMAELLGHNIIELIDADDKVLIDYSLLTRRNYSDRSGVSVHNARLTGLGIKLCKYISEDL